jgi:hypothetical protein
MTLNDAYQKITHVVKEIERAGYRFSGTINLHEPGGSGRLPEKAPVRPANPGLVAVVERLTTESFQGSAPPKPSSGNMCSKCGGVLVPNGRCELCTNCGDSTSCG